MQPWQHGPRPEILYPLFARVESLPGIGPRLAGLIQKRIGATVLDLLRHLPVSMIDRSQRPSVQTVSDGSIGTFEVLIQRHDLPPRNSRRPARIITETTDGQLELVFFHARGDYLQKQYPIGSKRLVSGRVERFQNRVQMAHPDHVLPLEQAASLPLREAVYPLTAGLTQKVVARAIADSCKRLTALPEWIEPALLESFGWPDWKQAMTCVHAPQSAAELLPGAAARTRLAYDELLANQLALGLVRHQERLGQGRGFAAEGRLVQNLTSSLPFALTGAQQRVQAEIAADQASGSRMLRLLQGDVGAGKTLVALMAMLGVVECGAQAALLAPTEILARQHHANLNKLLEPLGIAVGLLHGRQKAAEKRDIISQLADGSLKLVVGTHALLSERVQFHDLGLAVIDEQHRFGVAQRLQLTEKGQAVDILIMTATPIPRSLAMTAFGDLDVSRLDEKPPGRKPVTTTLQRHDRLDEIVNRLGQACSEDRQAYWICPLVEDSDALADIAAAEERFTMLKTALPQLNPQLVHGRMDAASRDLAMENFRSGSARLLVATTVIEVGVDVRQASIMVIEHAERFGLAQLHQLRGRVGRGETASSCLLLYKPPLSETAEARLRALRQSEDGFFLAEEDLRLRGPGEILGKRQSGDPDFSLADLAFHGDLLAAARDQASRILEKDPALQNPESESLKILLALFERQMATRYLDGG